MSNIVAIGGEPAVGKTTLMRKFFTSYTPWKQFKYKKLYGHFNEELHLVILGVYSAGEIFSGTDKLSMAVQPDFEEFIDKNKPNYNILFEGDRLFNLKTIKKCMQNSNLKIFIIESKHTNARHKDRNDNQTDKFIKGRKTKVNNIKDFCNENNLDVEIVTNDCLSDLNNNYNKILANFK